MYDGAVALSAVALFRPCLPTTDRVYKNTFTRKSKQINRESDRERQLLLSGITSNRSNGNYVNAKVKVQNDKSIKYVKYIMCLGWRTYSLGVGYLLNVRCTEGANM